MEELLRWLQLIILPALAGLYWLQMQGRRDLGEFKLEVAKNYASTAYLSDVEKRLLAVLQEIKQEVRELRREEIAELRKLTAKCAPSDPGRG